VKGRLDQMANEELDEKLRMLASMVRGLVDHTHVFLTEHAETLKENTMHQSEVLRENTQRLVDALNATQSHSAAIVSNRENDWIDRTAWTFIERKLSQGDQRYEEVIREGYERAKLAWRIRSEVLGDVWS